MADKDNDYEEEVNPVLMNFRHSKKPSNGLETEPHETEENEETGEPLQTKKERINILKKIKNDIETNKKKSESQEKINKTSSLPFPSTTLSDKESIMQRLLEAKKKKMELSGLFQGNTDQEEDQKQNNNEIQMVGRKTVEVSNEKIEKLKNLFSSKREKIEVETKVEYNKKDSEEGSDEEEVDHEKIERERIKQKLLKLALEKKQLKEQANLSLGLSKKNSKDDNSKNKLEQEQYNDNDNDRESESEKKEKEDGKQKEEKEKMNKIALLEKIVKNQKDKHVESKKEDDDNDEDEEKEENKGNNNSEKTNELRNIIEMMKNKKKQEEQKRLNEDEDEKEEEDEDEDIKAKERQREIEEKKAYERQLEKERLEKANEEKIKQEKEKERIKQEKIEKERLEIEKRERIEKERLERERLEKERLERERIEKERLERERLEKERLERERLEKERLVKRLERERVEKERFERDRLEKERIEREEEKHKRELKEKLYQEELAQKELQKQKQIDLMKQNELKLKKEIQQLRDEIQKQKLKQLQDIEYQKEIEFQKQLDKETQKQKEQQQKLLSTNKKSTSSIENTSYINDNAEPKGVANQCHSSKLIYNPKKPGIRGKSVDKPQDISLLTNNKSQLNSNSYSLISNYIDDSTNHTTEKPLCINGNNNKYNSSINLLTNHSSVDSNASTSSIYSKAPIYNRSPRRFAQAKQNLNKSPTASYVSSQYPQQFTQPFQLPKKDESEPIINLEDLLLLEEKLTDIIISLNTNKQMSNECFEWWNFFYNCSLFNKIEKTFQGETAKKIIQVSNNIELLSIIICYDVSFDKMALSQVFVMLKSILKLNHRNFMVICEHILNKISKDSLNNIWVFKLKNVIHSNMNKNSDEDFNKYFDSFIDEIKYNSSCISDYLRIVLKNYQNTKMIESLVILFKNINKKTYDEINLFFREKIMRVENRNASILASFLIRDNFKFQLVPTPYLKKPNLKKYTLVLDLDETLIHFKVNPNDDSQGVLLERPGILDFLETVGNYYELIIFTAAIQDYADPIINAIEERRLYFDYRLYRQHAVIIDNDFVKDLTRLGRPIDKMIIVDNMPQNFRLQKENGIFIRAFWGEDPYDTALIDLMHILINIALEGGDVRHGLSKNKEEIVRKVSSNISKNNKSY